MSTGRRGTEDPDGAWAMSSQPSFPSLGREFPAAFPIEPTWCNSSYQDRLAILCERLMAEGLYDAVCYIAAPTTGAGDSAWLGFGLGVRGGAAGGVAAGAGVGLVELVAAYS
jgi:hypothetical protein